MLDSVSHPELHTLRSLYTSHLKLDEELGAFEVAQDAGSGRLCMEFMGQVLKAERIR